MTSQRPLTLALATLASLAASSVSASAQDAQLSPAQSESEIVVSGTADRGEQKKAVNRFIRAVMKTEGSGQYARFNRPVCPSVIGFSKSVEALIEDRMRAVAQAANVPVAKARCKPNLHVVLVEDGPDAVKLLRRKARGAFGRMRPHERDRIERGPGPVYNFHAIYPISSEGGANRATQNGGGSGAVGVSAGILGDPAYNAGMTNVKSRIQMAVQQDIAHGVVLIEREAARGLSAVQVADFATMRGLLNAKGKAEDLGSVDTIMTLFGVSEDERLPGLTEWDLALLTSLYKAPANMNADRQRSQMAKVFQATLERQE